MHKLLQPDPSLI